MMGANKNDCTASWKFLIFWEKKERKKESEYRLNGKEQVGKCEILQRKQEDKRRREVKIMSCVVGKYKIKINNIRG